MTLAELSEFSLRALAEDINLPVWVHNIYIVYNDAF